MRYEELSLPLADSELRIGFHPRLTVLAGLSGVQRQAIIGAIAGATVGAVPGARISLVDASGRTNTVGDPTDPPDPGFADLGTASRMKNLIEVSAEDLGLPRPSDDPGQLALQSELQSARRQAAELRTQVTQVQRRNRQHAALLDELHRLEARLAELGSEMDRYTHRRARALVELEGVRAALAAVDAPANRRSRDRALVDSTMEIQHLADQWSEVSERLDVLRTQVGDQPRIEPDQLAELVDVPDAIPATLARAVHDHEHLLAQRDALQIELDTALEAPRLATPADTRVLVLATVDQETLWMTHRNVVMATDALQAAEADEARLALEDPGERDYVEQTKSDLDEAVERADHDWTRGILLATVSACIAGMLVITDLYLMAIPALLLLTIASIGLFIARPKLAVHKARQRHDSALAKVGASEIAEYRHRFRDDPESERWRRADRLIEDYQHAMQDWHELVGHISPEDAGHLEKSVAAWIAATDPERSESGPASVRRRLERLKAEISHESRQLSPLLSPFGLTIDTDSLSTALDRRVKEGRHARLQIELDDAVEVERKLTTHLESQLTTLGFETGNLTTRISAFGRELDAAMQREKLRDEGADRPALVADMERLESELAQPAPQFPHPDHDDTADVADLRRRRDELSARIAADEVVDDSSMQRRLEKVEQHIQGLEHSLTSDARVVVERPVDHLVATLLQHRPTWPTGELEPSPAILDDPFAALESDLKKRLLHAVGEVANVTQIVLLTDDDETTEWAKAEQADGGLSLVAPRPAG